MRLGEPTVREEGDETLVTAVVKLDDCEQEDWFVACPAKHRDHVDPSPNCFVPAAALLAAARGEDLHVDGLVSARLLAGTRAALDRMCQWWGFRVPTIDCAGVESTRRSGDGEHGLLFTRGADSTASLLRGVCGELPTPTVLLGFDDLEPVLSAEVAAQVWHDTEDAARSYGFELVRFRTNVRNAVHPFCPWEDSYGAVLLGATLVLGPLFATVQFSSSFAAGYERPHGSHPDLDFRWSTERTTIVPVGYDQTRVDKLAVVASDPRGLQWLRVCWERDTRWNCGQCVKCLITMSALAGLGVLGECPVFDAPLTAEAVAHARPAPAVALDEVLDAIRVLAPDVAALWDGYTPVRG